MRERLLLAQRHVHGADSNILLAHEHAGRSVLQFLSGRFAHDDAIAFSTNDLDRGARIDEVSFGEHVY